MKSRIFLLVVGLVALALLPAMNRTAANQRRRISAAEQALQLKLRQNISVDFVETPVSEVIDYLRTTLEINIVYDPPEGWTTEKHITLQLSSTSAESVLEWAVRLAELDCISIDGILYVSTRERVLKVAPTYFRQYYVRDLILLSGDMRRRDGDDDDDGDNDRDNDRNNGGNNDDGGRGSAEQELLNTIVLLTGADNWDHVEVIGVSSTEDGDDETESREDRF